MTRQPPTDAAQARSLRAVEFLGLSLSLALSAFLRPIGFVALWIGKAFLGRFRALRLRAAPRKDAASVASVRRDGEAPTEPPVHGRFRPQAAPRNDEAAVASVRRDGEAPTKPPSDTDTSDVDEPPAVTAQLTGPDHPPGRRTGEVHRARYVRHAFGVAGCYLLAVLTVALFVVLRRADSALQQMGIGKKAAGSALSFPGSWGNITDSLPRHRAQEAVRDIQTAWSAYQQDVAALEVLRDPFAVAQRLVVLDIGFVFCYLALSILVLLALIRVNARMFVSSREEPQRVRRSRMLFGAVGATVALAVVELAEAWQLQRSLVGKHDLAELPGGIALGPLMSLLKLPLALGVVVPALFVAIVLASRQRPLGLALKSIRGVLYAVAGLAVLLMTGVGAAQLDDVIRAWDGMATAYAVLACVALSVTVAGLASHLAGPAREAPAPEIGDSAQPLLLATGILLILLGQGARLVGMGWGISVAGALLVLLWALGLPMDQARPWPTLPGPLRKRGETFVLSITWAAGGIGGATVAWLAGWSVLLGAPLGVLVMLTALAAWSLAVEEQAPAAIDGSSYDAEPGADEVRAARDVAKAARASRDKALSAREAGDPRWLRYVDETQSYALRAQRLEEEARGEVIAATIQSPTTGAAAGTAIERAAAEAVASAEQSARTAREIADTEAMAVWGDRLGRTIGAVVTALVVVAIARTTALDLHVRAALDWAVVGWPLTGAAAIALGGIAVCVVRLPRSVGRLRLPPGWLLCTGGALLAGLWLIPDVNAVSGAQAAGSVAVVLGGFTLFIGIFGLLAAAVRRGPITRFALAPALQSLRFSRFPVLLFLLVWAFIVSTVDSGGFHDIRRSDRGVTTMAPTLGEAWQQYVRAAPPGGVRPVVFVGSQGGGIRAAVWTALVMECVFGPGPVKKSAKVCEESEGEPDPKTMAGRVKNPLPVFLASGASGSSVGLAAWSARRTDLLRDQVPSKTPVTIERALGHDFVAPDVARLLLTDVPHAFLAWNRADRAATLERAWEKPWYDDRPAGADGPAWGLTRGLRETWEVTHANGAWATPVLAFNGVSVEDSCRYLVSAVDFALPLQLPPDAADVDTEVDSTDDRPDDAACRGVGGGSGKAVDVLPSTSELIDYLCPSEDLPMSTAAHLSARFPYVSPTGRVERRNSCTEEEGLVPDPAVSYVADGGIFDNSGSGTAVDTWRALAPLAAATERQTGTCLVPIFLQIDNSPPSATVSSAVDPRPDELTAPINATLDQVSSRDRYARSGAASTFGRPTSAAGQRVTAGGSTAAGASWFRVSLFGQPGPEPPLGWALAPETVDDMRSQLRATSNASQIGELRRLLDGGLSCSRPEAAPDLAGTPSGGNR
jgi:hypothetical protein